MPPREKWPLRAKYVLTPDFAEAFATKIREGATVRQAALHFSIPPRTISNWLERGMEQTREVYDSERNLSLDAVDHEGKFWQEVAPALAERNLTELGKVDDAKWKLSHYDVEDFAPAPSKLEISGPEGAPIEWEGRQVVGFTDLVAFARSIGAGDRFGLSSAVPRGELPAAPDVLPDPPIDQRSAGVLPADGR